MAYTNDGFIKYGKSPQTLYYTLPFPTMGKALFQTERAVDSGRNANFVLIAQQVGKSVDKQNMGWDKIEPEKWWRFNQFLEENGMFFYLDYFNYNLGKVFVRQFYASSPQCDPVNVDKVTRKPEWLENAVVNVIMTGR